MFLPLDGAKGQRGRKEGPSIVLYRHRSCTNCVYFRAMWLCQCDTASELNHLMGIDSRLGYGRIVIITSHIIVTGSVYPGTKCIANMNLINIRTHDIILALLKVNSLSVNYKPLHHSGLDHSQCTQDLHHDREYLRRVFNQDLGFVDELRSQQVTSVTEKTANFAE